MTVPGARSAGRIAVLAVALFALAPAVVAAAAPSPARHVLHPDALPAPVFQPGQHWAVNRPMCEPAKSGARSCFAVARKSVPAGTPGAYPYTPAALHGPAGGLTPSALTKAYHVNPGGGSGQIVAIVDAYNDPHIWDELNAFDAHYHLARETSASFARVAQDGSRNFPSTDRGWAVEEALDVEAVRAMCHNCKIRLVEAKSASTWNLSRAAETAYQLGAKIISNSYGGPESRGEDARVQQAYSHKGVVVTASTGDDGWYAWDQINDGWSPNDGPDEPAAFPAVVAVGGTKLTLNSDGSVASERVWNRNGKADASGVRNGAQGASGGGCSHIYSAPSWQQQLASFPHLGCGKKRMVGDVAADADPTTGMDVYSAYVGGNRWETIGGTSLSAPLIAGMWAVAGGPAGADNPVATLYDSLAFRPGNLFDVRIGSNAFCGASDVTMSKSDCSRAASQLAGSGDPNLMRFNDGTSVGNVDCGWRLDRTRGTLNNDWQCRAHGGFDGPSGVGTPRGAGTFGPVVSVSLSPISSATVGTPVTATGTGTVAAAKDTLTRCVFYWGDGSAATTVSCSTGQQVSAQHTYRTAGRWAVHFVAVDAVGAQVGATRTVVSS